MKWAKGKLAQVLGVVVVATLMIFSGVVPAGAGVTIYHGIVRSLGAPGEISVEDWLNQSGVEVEPTSDIGGGS